MAAKTNRLKRGDVPVGCNHLTMFVDVQAALLFYVVVAWEDDFTGYVIDYGAWPDQRRRYFTLGEANPTLQAKFPRSGLEGCLYGGLKALTEDYLSREFTRDDGAAMRIEKCLVDANWGQSTDVVYQFCRESAFANVIIPSHGKYIGASSKPMSEYKKAVGDRVGRTFVASGPSGTSSSTRTTRRALSPRVCSSRWGTVVRFRSGDEAPRRTCCSRSI